MGEALNFILFVLGLLLIIKGSDWFVESSVWFAKAFHVPQIIIGATIVSICTTLPETLVSVTAAVKGETDMAVGAAFGSIITNTGFILGIMLVFMTVTVDNRKDFLRNSVFLLASLLLIFIFGSSSGEIGFVQGIVLVLVLIIYLINNVVSARKTMIAENKLKDYDIEPESGKLFSAEGGDKEGAAVSGEAEGVIYDTEEEDYDISVKQIVRRVVFFLVGVFMVVIGANLLVDNGIKIAEFLGVPVLLISIIFAAFGTSLPELVTVITSMRKGATDMGMGNIIGANILNVVQVIGISALLEPISLTDDPSIMVFQIPLAFVICGLVICFGIFQKKHTHKWNGIVLLLIYALFLVVNLMRESTPLIGGLIF